jgi:hypothetical protein
VSRPFRKVQDFQAELQAVRDRSPTVSRTRRGLALLLHGVVLALGAGFMLTFSFAFIQVATLWTFLIADPLGHVAREDLQEEIRRNQELMKATPDLALATRLEQDRRTQAQLGDDLQFIHERRESVLASSSWFVRNAVNYLDGKLRDGMRVQVHSLKTPQENVPEITPDATQNATNVHQVVTEQQAAWSGIGWREAGQGVALLLVCPILWIFWAGVTRGGLCLPLTGIVVVQQDGRRAAGWRCVLRAALIWAPFVALLIASFLLDLWRVAQPGPVMELWIPAWLGWLAWWLAVVWLPLHLALCLRWPECSWHDHLAGTFLVPR